MANDLILLNDGTSKVLLNNGTDRLALNSETAAEVTVDMWHRTGGAIVRAAKLAVVGQIVFAAIAPDTFHVVAAPNVTVTRPKTVLVQSYTRSPYAPEDDNPKWFRPLSEPTRKTVSRQSPQPWTPYVDQAEVVTIDKWQRSVGVYFTKPSIAVIGQINFGAIPPDTYHVVNSTDVPVIFNRTRLAPAYARVPYVEAAAEVVTSDKWLAPFSQPTRRKRFLEAEVAQSPTLVEDAAIQAKWFQPFSLPRAAKRVPEFPAYSYSPYFEPPSTATLEYAWYRPFSEPTRRTLSRASVPYIAYQRQPDTGTADGLAGATFAGPIFRRHLLSQTLAFVPATDVGVASWYQPFDEPVRRKRFLETDIAWSSWVNQTGTGTEYNWFVPLNIPIRLAAERVADFPSFFYSPYFVPPISGIGTEFNWWPNVSERIRVRSPVTQQQTAIQGPAQPITATLEYAWYQPFSQRLDRAKRVSEFPAFSFSPYIVTLEYGWYRPFSERLNRAERVPDFPAYAQSPYFEPSLSGTGTEYNWWPNLSERIRVRSPVTQQQTVIQGTQFPFIDIGWHRPLSEPTRRKRRVAGEEGSVFFVGDFSVTYAWRQPLSEPTRAKAKLHQSTFYTSYIPPVGTGDGKSQPWPDWSKPTRRVTNKQLFAGLTWTSIFQLGEFDPGRVVCVYPDSRQVNVYFDFDVVPLEESSEVSVPLESRVVDVDVESRIVTVTQEPSCQDS